MAPSLFEVKGANEQDKQFHYQLETTLFGPLIDKFRNLLEEELSIYASAQLISQESIEKEKTRI